jgi:cytidylate kinase
MYRAVAWLALKEGVGTDDENGLTGLAGSADIRFKQSGMEEAQLVFCRGTDITGEIRSLAVSEAVVKVSSFAGVRRTLVEAQRQLASGQNVVMDGRDIATVVLPDAECKIFLTASLEERAKRRLKERAGITDGQALDDIVLELEKRDFEDSNRAESPLRRAAGSVLLDTTAMDFDDVVAKALCIIRSSIPPIALD